MASHNFRVTSVLLMLVCVYGCIANRKPCHLCAVPPSDPLMIPLNNMYKADRSATGLSPIPINTPAELWLCRQAKAYDAKVRFNSKIKKTLLFNKRKGSYQLTAEVDKYEGPTYYKINGVEKRECIDICYDYRSGDSWVTYSGPDGKDKLIRGELYYLPYKSFRDSVVWVLPLLKEWGY